jgi:hypothetical protein
MAWALRSPPFLPIQGNCPSSHLVFLLLRAKLGVINFRKYSALAQAAGLVEMGREREGRDWIAMTERGKQVIDPGEARLDQLVASRSQLAVLRIGLAHRADHNQDGLKVL